MSPQKQTLIEKIAALPDERVHEVEDFIDFLTSRATDHALAKASQQASERSFVKVWDNPEDSVYDVL